MKKYLSVFILLVLIAPSVAMASLWNPLSWKIFSFLHKKEVVPQTQVETQKTPEEKISDLQKQIDKLKNKQSDSTTIKTQVVSNSNTTIPKTNTTPVIKQKTDEVSSRSLVVLIDNLISNYNSTIDYANNFLDIVNTRINNISQGKEVVSSAMKSETNSFMLKDWQWAYNTINNEITWQNSVVDNEDNIIKLMKDEIVGLEKLKNSFSSFITSEDYLSTYNNLETHYKNIDSFKKIVDQAIENQSIATNKTQPLWDSWKKDVDELASLIYKDSIKSNISTYQPVVIPQIQVPKTTYCTMGQMSGTQSYYSITCN